jgi:retinol dehydrogenase 12
MKGTVCVVTGATSGIGKAAATALARLGATVVMVGRDRGRTEAAAAQIAPVSASPPRAEIADLASLEQVRGLAGRLAGLDRIDVLINNAGLVLGERRITPDGLEHVFALNHLAPFLLTNLLLPKLTASAPARVVTVTSDAHSAARLDLSDPNLEHGWDSWRSYANSKLANILFTRELARRLDGTGVTANCAHPGVVRTGFGRESRPVLRLGITIARPFMLSPERGAGTIVYLASSPDVAGQTGGYYVKRQQREPSAAARDDTLARELWELRRLCRTSTDPPARCGSGTSTCRSSATTRSWCGYGRPVSTRAFGIS